MATTRRSDLVDEIEKALRDEAYDGGMGALAPEQFTDYVRGLAVTAAKVVEEAHTPTDDEREAQANRYVAGRGDSQTRRDFLAGWDAALRRSEVPEPSAEEFRLIETAGSFREQVGDSASPGSLVDLWLRTAAALEARVGTKSPEPQGEPSDAQVEAALIAHLGYDPAPAGFPFKDDEKDQMRAALRAAEEAKR